MAYVLSKRTWKLADGSCTETWRLRIQHGAGKGSSWLSIRKADLGKYGGLDESDSYEVAKSKLESFRAYQKVTRQIEKTAMIDARLKKQDLKESAFLPRGLYLRFLADLKERRIWDEIPKKVQFNLRCMRKLILELNVDPSLYGARPALVYGWFKNKGFSISYIQKVLPLLNDYAYFYGVALKKPSRPVPLPRGEIARRIEEANLQKRKHTNESLPLRPSQLSLMESMKPEQLAWMRYSTYFGLRPREVDSLTADNRGTTWEVRELGGMTILCVFQTKLIGVSRPRRWKRIPCLLPEQRELVAKLLCGVELKRPLVKIIQKYVGPGYTTYAGRKGFERFMREDHGQDFRNISRWLGHQDINQTERSYRETDAVEYRAV